MFGSGCLVGMLASVSAGALLMASNSYGSVQQSNDNGATWLPTSQLPSNFSFPPKSLALVSNSTNQIVEIGSNFSSIFGDPTFFLFGAAPYTIGSQSRPLPLNSGAVYPWTCLGTGTLSGNGTNVVMSSNGKSAWQLNSNSSWNLVTLPLLPNGGSGVAASIADIAWNGTVFCAIAANPQTYAVAGPTINQHLCYGAMTSSNATSWTVQQTPRFIDTSGAGPLFPQYSPSWISICKKGTGFAMVGGPQLNSVGNITSHVATSPNGVDWTDHAVPYASFGSPNYTDIAASASTIVLVASGTDKVATSTNSGSTWTQYSLPSSGDWNSITYDGTNFIAIKTSTGGTSNAAISADGITWTAVAIGNANWTSIDSNSTYVVATANGTNDMVYSADHGNTWISNQNCGDAVLLNIIYTGNEFIATNYGGASLKGFYRSIDDGVTWTAGLTDVAKKWAGIAHNGSGTIVSVGDGGGVSSTKQLARSTDGGVTWATITLTNASALYDCLVWNGSKFLTFSIDGAQRSTWTSTDGITWVEHTNSLVNDSLNRRGLCWNGTVFVYVIGGTNKAYTSTDGITWTARTMPTTAANGWVSVAWNGTIFCAVNNDDQGTMTCATSPDGITWTARTMGIDLVAFNKVTWNGESFIAVGQNPNGNYVSSRSKDGITWTSTVILSSFSSPSSVISKHFNFTTY